MLYIEVTVVLSIPPSLLAGPPASMSRSLALLGNLAVLLSPVTREVIADRPPDMDLV